MKRVRIEKGEEALIPRWGIDISKTRHNAETDMKKKCINESPPKFCSSEGETNCRKGSLFVFLCASLPYFHYRSKATLDIQKAHRERGLAYWYCWNGFQRTGLGWENFVYSIGVRHLREGRRTSIYKGRTLGWTREQIWINSRELEYKN